MKCYNQLQKCWRTLSKKGIYRHHQIAKEKFGTKKKTKQKLHPSQIRCCPWYCCWAEMYYVGSHDGQFSVVVVTCLNYLFASGCDILMKASLSVSLYLCRIIKKFIFAFSRWSVFHHLQDFLIWIVLRNGKLSVNILQTNKLLPFLPAKIQSKLYIAINNNSETS